MTDKALQPILPVIFKKYPYAFLVRVDPLGEQSHSVMRGGKYCPDASVTSLPWR